MRWAPGAQGPFIIGGPGGPGTPLGGTRALGPRGPRAQGQAVLKDIHTVLKDASRFWK